MHGHQCLRQIRALLCGGVLGLLELADIGDGECAALFDQPFLGGCFLERARVLYRTLNPVLGHFLAPP